MATDLRERAELDTGSRERALLGALFVLGFGVRWLFADGDFFGDESWYFYLSQGFGREPAVQFEQPWFHIANRPLFYAFYHLSTYGGLLSFRLLGCAIGALVPVLAFVAARRFGASLQSAALSACCLTVQAQQVRYSAAVFPDPLAAAFGLGAVWAVAARARAAACALTICCVATKESFIAVPALIVTLDLLMQRERFRVTRWHVLTFSIPVAYVCILTGMALTSSKLRLQGWADSPFSLRHARSMWVGWELWPWLAWLVWRRQLRTLALWLALPSFYLLWSRGLGRGLAPWYVVGPAAFSSVAVALALDEVYAACKRWAAPQLKAAAPRLALGLCLLCLAPIPLVGLAQVRAQWRQLDGRFPKPDAATRVQAVIAEQEPARLLLVNCFWAYRYSHLRWGEPSQSVWWYNDSSTNEVLHNAEASTLIVTCKIPGREQIERRLSEAPFELLYEDHNYLVSKSAVPSHAVRD